MEAELIDIDVRNLQGRMWAEKWTRDKLAYFVLMSDVEVPKFEKAMELEWVPYDCNSYHWNKAALTREEFERLIVQWPGREPIPFNPATCDSVQFVSRTARRTVGWGFDAERGPNLFIRIVELTTRHLQYETFNYACARHIFVGEIDATTAATFMKVAEPELRQVNHSYVRTLRTIPRTKLEVRFLCRDGCFEAPFGIWYES
jgi:hypothetical protein